VNGEAENTKSTLTRKTIGICEKKNWMLFYGGGGALDYRATKGKKKKKKSLGDDRRRPSKINSYGPKKFDL